MSVAHSQSVNYFNLSTKYTLRCREKDVNLWVLRILTMNPKDTFLWKRHFFLLKNSSKIHNRLDRETNKCNILLISFESIQSKDTCECVCAYLGHIHKFYGSNHFVLFRQDRSRSCSSSSKPSVYILWWELTKFRFSSKFVVAKTFINNRQ